MKDEKWGKLLYAVKEQKPLVHCITNNVTINDCANIVLGVGASPIMAIHTKEVEEISSIASALVLNIGIAGPDTEAMLLAGKKCNALDKPIVFDPVGMGASTLRSEITNKILSHMQVSVIRGNISEMKALDGTEGDTRGVDASEEDKKSGIDGVIALAKRLSKKYKAVVAISGEIDVVAYKEEAYTVSNGHGMMERITGAGCMLTALMGAFCGANKEDLLYATVVASALMGLAGEQAYHKMLQTKGGTLSFRTYLIDAISMLTEEELERGSKIEKR